MSKYGEKKTAVIHFKVTAEEKDLLKKVAEDSDMFISEYIRKIIKKILKRSF